MLLILLNISEHRHDEKLQVGQLGLRYIECNFWNKIDNLPTRFLPPGNIRMLFHQMAAALPEGEKVSCLP